MSDLPLSGDPPPPSPRAATNIAIGRIVVSGADPRIANRIAPAIERALAAAQAEGRLAAGARDRIILGLPHGATSDAIARALIRALEGDGRPAGGISDDEASPERFPAA